MNSKLVNIVEQYDNDNGNYADNLNSMGQEDMEIIYGLDKADAGLLYLVVQGAIDPRYNIYGLHGKYDTRLVDNIKESVHQSLDGWSDMEKIVIRAYLSDLAYSVTV